jgi:plastocyanin
LLLVGLLALVLVAACAADPDDSVPVAEAPTTVAGEEGSEDTIPVPDDLEDLTGQDVVTVAVKDNTFEPRNIRVDAGTQIVFELEGFNAHNVRPGVEGLFPEITDPDLQAGNASLQVAEPGALPYYCSLHGTATVGMTGYILAE